MHPKTERHKLVEQMRGQCACWHTNNTCPVTSIQGDTVATVSKKHSTTDESLLLYIAHQGIDAYITISWIMANWWCLATISAWLTGMHGKNSLINYNFWTPCQLASPGFHIITAGTRHTLLASVKPVLQPSYCSWELESRQMQWTWRASKCSHKKRSPWTFIRLSGIYLLFKYSTVNTGLQAYKLHARIKQNHSADTLPMVFHLHLHCWQPPVLVWLLWETVFQF